MPNRLPRFPPGPGGVYIHVPFCRKKCRYCDFYSVSDLDRLPIFVDALLAEMALVAPGFSFPCDTLYFGGGTPSLLPPADVARLVEGVRAHFRLSSSAEITLEANPGTVTPESLSAFRRAGINRLSLGVQSLDAEQLRRLGRIHSPAEATKAFRDARRAGFSNIGIDLIYGLPSQSEAAWRRELARAAELGPEHISAYLLAWAPGTPLHRDRGLGRVRPPSEEIAARLFDVTFQALADLGYPAYEISNFARFPEFRSRHNQKYWTHAPYLGLGPAAHGFHPPERSWNLPSVRAHVAALRKGRVPVAGRERLGPAELAVEAVYLGLRRLDGVDIRRWTAMFGNDFDQIFAGALDIFRGEGWMETSGPFRRLTDRGRPRMDGIVNCLVGEIRENNFPENGD
ncbi:MAG: radical SAM family heme chaperone HemW [Desulfococcaceae bacterium]